jgi:WD40 repeat protein
VSGGKENTIRVWNFNSKTEEGVLKGHSNSVKSIAIASDNKYVVSGNWDRTVII